ncbi:DUF6707 family protein [Armatimonas rosea]|uniref:Uncharacterized protein n=1 Tax=Armatimonas rosea TaxID=685828 RepID=A0A7W9SNG5_ARMRO|nr:hypothetical protein [Armatimonas rosea]
MPERIVEAICLPNSFDAVGDTSPFMARMKHRASKDFRWSTSRALEDAMYLAYWSYVFQRDQDALETCTFLTQYAFADNHKLWGWVERTLALQARLLHSVGETELARACIERIRVAGFVEARLEGRLTSGYQRNIAHTQSDGRKTSERDWRAIYATELCVLIELGGSSVLPVAQLEELWQENLSWLRACVGVT